MRESMARLTTRFSSNRMLREYVERYYLSYNFVQCMLYEVITARLTRMKAQVMAGAACRVRPVWPSATRAIMPSVIVPMPPVVNAWRNNFV